EANGYPVEVAPRSAAGKADPSRWFLTKAEIEAARTGAGEGSPRTLSVFTSKNLVTPLVDGEEMMRAIFDDVTATKSGDVIHFTGWRMELGTELVPTVSGSSVKDVWVNAIKRKVASRTLLWRPVGGAAVPRYFGPNGKDNRDVVREFDRRGGEAV